jgi:hypothetical protein
MDPSVREIVLLALLCAFLCGIALMYERQLVAAVFAALACSTVVLAVVLRRLPCASSLSLAHHAEFRSVPPVNRNATARDHRGPAGISRMTEPRFSHRGSQQRTAHWGTGKNRGNRAVQGLAYAECCTCDVMAVTECRNQTASDILLRPHQTGSRS